MKISSPSSEPGREDATRLDADGLRGGTLVVFNEFGAVTVRLDLRGHSPRLAIRNEKSGHELLLDALTLAALADTEIDDLKPFLDPGRDPSARAQYAEPR